MLCLRQMNCSINLEDVSQTLEHFGKQLWFSLHCKYHNIIAVSLKLISTIHGKKVSAILHGAQRSLLLVRIRQINQKVTTLNNNRVAREASIDYTKVQDRLKIGEINQFIAHVYKAEYTRSKQCQMKTAIGGNQTIHEKSFAKITGLKF